MCSNVVMCSKLPGLKLSVEDKLAAERLRERWARISTFFLSKHTPRNVIDWLGARMLLRIFTNSLTNSISDGAVCLYGWLACHVTKLRSAIHPYNENAHPARSEGGESRVHALRESQLQQENRVLVRCARERKPQKTHVMRCYLNVKVRVLKSTDTSSPRGESAPGSVPAKSSRTDACRALCWWAWDVVWAE